MEAMIAKQTEQVRKRIEKIIKDTQEHQRRWDEVNTRGADVASALVNHHLRVQYH